MPIKDHRPTTQELRMAQARVAELEALYGAAMNRAIFAEASRDAALETNAKLWELMKVSMEARPAAPAPPAPQASVPPVLAPNLAAQGASHAHKSPAPFDPHSTIYPTIVDRLTSQMVLLDHTKRDWPHDVVLQQANDQLSLPIVPSIETN